MTNGSLMKVESIAGCSRWSKIGLENQFVVYLRVTVLHRFYCIVPASFAIVREAIYSRCILFKDIRVHVLCIM